MDNRKIWLVEHPTYRYKEDVKALALQNQLKVICPIARASLGLPPVADEFKVSDKDAPKLTLKDEFKPKRTRTTSKESDTE